MAAGKKNFDVYQGATFTATVACKKSDATAYDLTGHTVKGQIRAKETSSDLIVDFTCAVQSPASAGLIDISLTATQTVLITTDGVYDILVTKTATGTVYRVLEGKITLHEGVTK